MQKQQYVLTVKSRKNNVEPISIVYDDPSRESIIIDSVKRIINYLNGRITYEELDEETLAPEVLAVGGQLN